MKKICEQKVVSVLKLYVLSLLLKDNIQENTVIAENPGPYLLIIGAITYIEYK